MAVAFRNVEAATLATDGSPPITRTTFPTCRAYYPGGSSGCPCRLLPAPVGAFPVWQVGRHPHCHFRGLLRLHSRYGPSDRSTTSAEVVPHLAWPGAAQVVRIERKREIKDQVATQIAYYVTSLASHEAGPDRLMALARAHWGIKNRLHWRRDVSMNEDRCRVRAGAR